MITGLHLSSKSRHKKAQLTEAQFVPVLNWASVAQSGSGTAVVEEVKHRSPTELEHLLRGPNRSRGTILL